MDIRSELVRLAQAGEPAAIQSFIEQNHALVYRMALTILNESTEATRAARDSEAALIENLVHYPGPAAHTAWVYQITLQVCRRRLRWRRVVRRFAATCPPWHQRPHLPWMRVPGGQVCGRPQRVTRAWRLPRGVRARLNLPELKPEQGVWSAVDQLADDLRLPLVLRYMHDLLPAEIAQVLNWRDGSVQSRLRQARAQLRHQYPEESQAGLLAGSEGDLSHRQAEKLLEEAADYHITDADAVLLNHHLKQCPRCQEAARRLAAFENELRSTFHLRWDNEPVPAVGAAAALDQRRRQKALKQSLNLAGAVLVTVCVVGLIFWAPALLPEHPLPQPPAAPPPAPTPAPTAVVTEQPEPTPGRRARSTQRPFPSDEVVTPVPFSRLDLLAHVYSGKIAFSAFSDLTDHVFTYVPGERDAQQLSSGISENSFPTWSPDGTQIAYLSQPPGQGPNQIMVMNVDGSDPHPVTPLDFLGAVPAKPEPNGAINSPLYGPPHWSADGKSVASAVWANSTSQFVAVYPILGVSDGKQLTLPVKNLDRSFLDWSPDGSTIAYLDKNGRELWLWEPAQPLLAGQNPRQIYFDGAWDMLFGMVWSPDSYSLAVITGLREQDVVQTDLRIVRKYGIEVKDIPISIGILTRTPLRSSNLTWSPDAVYLAFTPVFTNSDLVSGKVLLVRAEGRSVLPPLAVMAREVNGLTWSPDGRWLAFASGFEIWAASLDSYETDEASLVRLTRAVGNSLTWQPKPPGNYR